jgi:hypothetical protein
VVGNQYRKYLKKISAKSNLRRVARFSPPSAATPLVDVTVDVAVDVVTVDVAVDVVTVDVAVLDLVAVDVVVDVVEDVRVEVSWRGWKV